MRNASLLLVAVLCLVGCNDSSDEQIETAPPYAGNALTLHVPEDSGLTEYLEPFVEEWNARTGAEASISPFTDAKQLQPEPGDLLLTGINDIARFAAQLAPIPEGTPGRDELGWTKLMRGLREGVAKRGNESRVVPLSTPPLVCCFREDLLEAAGLDAPTTWLEYNKLVETLDQWAPGLKAVEPWHAYHRATMFSARTLAYASPPGSLSVFFDINDGLPRIATSGFVRGLDHFKTIAPAFAGCWEMTPAECRHALLHGTAAIGIMFEPSLRPADTERKEGVKLGFCQLPGASSSFNQSLGQWTKEKLNRPTLLGADGYVAAIVDAESLIALRAASSLLAGIVEATTGQTGSPIRGFTSQWQIDIAPSLYEPGLNVDESTDYVRAVADSLKNSQVVLEIPVSNRDAFRAAIAETLTAESIANRTAEDLLKEIETSWQKLVEETGPGMVNDYRRNIGIREK